MNKQLLTALNKQINNELYSAYFYLGMCSYFNTLNLKGFYNWMTIQAQEELQHAMKIYNYLNERGVNVTLSEIAKPPQSWQSTQEVFTVALQHEQNVTAAINNLVSIAKEVKDHAAEIFLQWFVIEQVEEEASFGEILQKLQLAADNPSALLFLDAEVGKRALPTTNNQT